MQLVLVADGSGAALEIRHIGVVVGHDERAFELSRTGGVDAEVGAQLHRAAHALGDVDEGAVGEHRRVEGGVEIIGVGHDLAQIFAHKLGIFPDSLGERAEDDALLGKFGSVGGLYGYRVHDGVDGHSAELFLLLEGYAQAVEGVEQGRVDLVEALGAFLGLGGGEVGDGLEVYFGDFEVRPPGRRQRQPVTEGLEAEVEQPLGLALQARDCAHHFLVEAALEDVRVYVGHEAVFVLLPDGLVDGAPVGILLSGFGAEMCFIVTVLIVHVYSTLSAYKLFTACRFNLQS